MHAWLLLATEKAVVRRALRVAGVVGTILIVINHGAALIAGDVTVHRLAQIVLTLLVPYCVSTYSSVGATLAIRAQGRAGMKI